MTDLKLAPRDFMPALTTAEAVQRYNALVEFVRTVMRRDTDFGVIPGTQKPTLLKPGAEKLCTLFGLRPQFELIDSEKNWEKGFFYFHYRCLLIRNGDIIASGEGSCNSREKKYRWRYVPEFKATDDEKANAIRRENKESKNGRPYVMLVLENAEPFDLVNTIQKIGQKRALIAAVLIGVNASEFFTQDIEDMIIESDWREAPAPTSAPADESDAPPALTPTPKPTNGAQTEAPQRKTASITGVDSARWQSLCRQLAEKHPHYARNGQPDFFHILGAALKEGFAEVNNANMEAVIEAISIRAAQKDEQK